MMLGPGGLRQVNYEDDVSAVAVVGGGMRGAKGIAAKVFGAVAASGINVRMIAQGSSEQNISFVVHEGDGKEAVRAVHRAFQLEKLNSSTSPAPCSRGPRMKIHYTVIDGPARDALLRGDHEDRGVERVGPGRFRQTRHAGLDPGSYLVREFARNVLRSHGVGRLREGTPGREGREGQLDGRPRRLRHASRSEYRVYAFRHDTNQSYLDTDHAVINGASVFLYARRAAEPAGVARDRPALRDGASSRRAWSRFPRQAGLSSPRTTTSWSTRPSRWATSTCTRSRCRA